MNLPLSTVQRRTRKIVEQDILTSQNHLNHSKFGYKIGVLHTNLSNGNPKEIAQKVFELHGISSVEIHIGNADMIAEYIYKNGNELLDAIPKINKINGVK